MGGNHYWDSSIIERSEEERVDCFHKGIDKCNQWWMQIHRVEKIIILYLLVFIVWNHLCSMWCSACLDIVWQSWISNNILNSWNAVYPTPDSSQIMYALIRLYGPSYCYQQWIMECLKETTRFIVDSYHYINHRANDYFVEMSIQAPLNGSALTCSCGRCQWNAHYKRASIPGLFLSLGLNKKFVNIDFQHVTTKCMARRIWNHTQENDCLQLHNVLNMQCCLIHTQQVIRKQRWRQQGRWWGWRRLRLKMRKIDMYLIYWYDL